MNKLTKTDPNTAKDATAEPARVIPFDRLPDLTFFGAPPRASLYHTKRAEAARQRAELAVADELAEARNALAAAGLQRVNSKFADAADHNAMTLAYALRYAAHGLHVIDSHAIDPRTGEGTGPLDSAKLPRGNGWQKRATNDPADVITFWTGDGEYPADKKGKSYRYAPPHAPRNVSIVLPEGCGLFVLDIDGEDGKRALAALIEDNGELPRTPQSVSGSGGLHFIFRTSRPIRNTASQIEAGVDIRGEGGQIIAAPSIHKTGNFYQWAEGCAPWECDVADAPEWLEELAFSASKKNAKGKPKAATTKRVAKKTARVAASGGGFDFLCERIGDDADGFDSPINSAACAWWRDNPNGDADDLKDVLRDVILAAPCDDDRAESRYETDDYLDARIEDARVFVEANPEDEDEPTDETRFETIRDWLPAGYKVRGGMVYRIGDEDDGDTPLCQAFDLVGSAANLAGNAEAGVIIHFENRYSVPVEVTLSLRDLTAPTGGGVVEDLAGMGMRILARSKRDRDALLDLFCRMTPRRHSPTVPRPGWVRDGGGNLIGYMCPTGEYIEAEPSHPFRLATAATVVDRVSGGSLAGWQDAANAAFENIGTAPPNYYWIIGACAGFAGPLLALINGESRGFHFSGGKNKGKTTALLLGATAWATPRDKKGVCFTMSGTANAMELTCIKGSESVLALDELGAMKNPQDLQSMLFGFANGSTKSRMAGRSASAGLSEDADFLTFILMSSEHDLMDAINASGERYRGGVSRRFPDLDVSGGLDVGDAIRDRFKKLTRNYGHAGPEFVRWLIREGWHLEGDKIAEMIEAAAKVLAGDANAAQKSAALVFATVQIAGELACDAGILINKDKVRAAVLTAWQTFKGSDAGKMTEGETAVLDGFKSWLVRNMGTRIVDAGDTATHFKGLVGWFTKDSFILLKDGLAMSEMGIDGSIGGLCAALNGIGAIKQKGKNNWHPDLPVGVGGDVSGGKVNNLRLSRKALGLE